MRAINTYGIGTGSSRTATGYGDLHRELEDQIATLYEKEAAIIFPTGFDAIATPIQHLVSSRDRIIVDRACHASIFEGAKSSGASLKVFKHNDLEHLEKVLKSSRSLNQSFGILVVVEGVYSLEGTAPNLKETLDLCRRYSAKLIVDEAHSIGILGDSKLGQSDQQGVRGQCDMICGTFSKSVGGVGGFLAADQSVIDYLSFHAGKLIFSTALPPLLAASALEGLKIISTDTSIHKTMKENLDFARNIFKKYANELPWDKGASIPILFGEEHKIPNIVHGLMRKGIYAFPYAHPSVPRNKARLRISIQRKHSRNHILRLFESLQELEIIRS